MNVSRPAKRKRTAKRPRHEQSGWRIGRAFPEGDLPNGRSEETLVARCKGSAPEAGTLVVLQSDEAGESLCSAPASIVLACGTLSYILIEPTRRASVSFFILLANRAAMRRRAAFRSSFASPRTRSGD